MISNIKWNFEYSYVNIYVCNAVGVVSWYGPRSRIAHTGNQLGPAWEQCLGHTNLPRTPRCHTSLPCINIHSPVRYCLIWISKLIFHNYNMNMFTLEFNITVYIVFIVNVIISVSSNKL